MAYKVKMRSGLTLAMVGCYSMGSRWWELVKSDYLPSFQEDDKYIL